MHAGSHVRDTPVIGASNGWDQRVYSVLTWTLHVRLELQIKIYLLAPERRTLYLLLGYPTPLRKVAR